MRGKKKNVLGWKQVTKAVKASDDDALSPAQLAALERLGVAPKQLVQAPRITILLEQADGGLKTVFSAMRLSRDPVIQAFLEKYDSIPGNSRMRVPMEAVALSAGIDLHSLLGAIMFALERQAVNIVKIMAMTAHPKIVAARIRFGSLPGGHQDRTALDQAMGFLPSPKGPTFIGKAVFGSGRDTMDQQRLQRRKDDDLPDDEDDMDEMPIPASGNGYDYDLDKLFPPANRMQEKLALIRQRTLPPDTGKKTPLQ
jgi:hypothetical protein